MHFQLGFTCTQVQTGLFPALSPIFSIGGAIGSPLDLLLELVEQMRSVLVAWEEVGPSRMLEVVVITV
jgi:hypothetical protein